MKYQDFNFANWGNGDYSGKLNMLFNLFKTQNPLLLCTIDKGFSQTFKHLLRKNENETIIYWPLAKFNCGEDLLSPNVEVCLLLKRTHEFIIDSENEFRFKYYYN